MHYAEFAEDESQALLSAIKDYENNKWKTIGQKVGKPAKVSPAALDLLTSKPTVHSFSLRIPFLTHFSNTGLRTICEGAFP